jgi:hypothetical protein
MECGQPGCYNVLTRSLGERNICREDFLAVCGLDHLGTFLGGMTFLIGQLAFASVMTGWFLVGTYCIMGVGIPYTSSKLKISSRVCIYTLSRIL